jgi:hypothetical protein
MFLLVGASFLNHLFVGLWELVFDIFLRHPLLIDVTAEDFAIEFLILRFRSTKGGWFHNFVGLVVRQSVPLRLLMSDNFCTRMY